MAYYYKSNVLADGPIRYYRLGEATGTTAIDLGSQAKNGTLNGGITLAQTGLIASDPDTCMLFNGSTGYISLPTTGLPTGASAWSMEAWVKFSSVPGSAYHGVMMIGTASTTQVAFIYYLGGTGWTLSDSAADLIVGSSVATAGTIYHIVGTYNGTTATLYVNGVSIGTATVTFNITAGSAQIGQDSASDFLGGYIDEVAIYNTALSAARIKNHYTAGLADPTLMACISGNEGSVSGFYQGSVGG